MIKEDSKTRGAGVEGAERKENTAVRLLLSEMGSQWKVLSRGVIQPDLGFLDGINVRHERNRSEG